MTHERGQPAPGSRRLTGRMLLTNYIKITMQIHVLGSHNMAGALGSRSLNYAVSSNAMSLHVDWVFVQNFTVAEHTLIPQFIPDPTTIWTRHLSSSLGPS